MNIKTWLERMPARLPEDQLNCTLQQVSAMQAEIDELRAALASAESLQIATYTQVVVLDEKVAAQRRVLEQALEALHQYTTNKLTVGQRYTNEGQQLLDAITAIQEQLHEHN